MNEELKRLRAKYGSARPGEIFDPSFKKIAANIMHMDGRRPAPYAGIPALLGAPYVPAPVEGVDFGGLQVALVGVPMDLGVSNRSGARFGPRAVRAIERIGPYNHVLKCAPMTALRVADIGDVPFRSRYDLEVAHADILAFYRRLVAAGITPVSVGGDHSISHPILEAIGAARPVGLIHIDAHCDTAGPLEGSRFHHGGPFRNAVLDGVLDPKRTIQIGIRGAAEYFWEFSLESGMTVIHIEEFARIGVDAVIAKARQVVGAGPVYLSFDIDALDPSFAPGTGTPEIGGLTTREAQALLRGLRGIDVIGGDVVEVAPQYDSTTNTAQVSAQMLFEILSLLPFSPSAAGRAGTCGP